MTSGVYVDQSFSDDVFACAADLMSLCQKRMWLLLLLLMMMMMLLLA